MSGLGRYRRLWNIYRVVRRYGLTEFVGRPAGTHAQPRGERLRLALEELGPVFVKLGQALSTRPDILPPDVAFELVKLQDRVPPFPGDESVRLIEASLGKPVDELFAEFDRVPLASASVAQVHTARLRPATDGDPGFEVVVKVIRPGIRATIESDIEVMYLLADLATRFNEHAARVRPREVVAEYEKIVLDELDLMREAANAAQLRRNWLGSELIYHPVIFWDYTRPNVLVMERIHGLSIRELDTLRGIGVDFQVLAERGVEIFFKQTFRDNFFHADMHPGNIFVDASDPRRPSYLAVDFGIVGQLTSSDQRYLAENFLAFFNRDYHRVAELHVESGWVPEGTRVEEFESAIRTICEPIFQKPLKDISFGFFLLRLFEVARRFDYQVQPQLVLLQKTLLNIEGLGRQLYPELDLWKTAKPIMEDWMRRRLSPARMLERARIEVPIFMEKLPDLVQNAVTRLERNESIADVTRHELRALRAELQRSQRRQRLTTIGATAVLSAFVLLGLDGLRPLLISGVPAASWLLGLVGLLCWITAWRRV